jgi:hypothetical protein
MELNKIKLITKFYIFFLCSQREVSYVLTLRSVKSIISSQSIMKWKQTLNVEDEDT